MTGVTKDVSELNEEDFKKLLENKIGLSDKVEMERIAQCVDWIRKSNKANYFDLVDSIPRIGQQLELRPDIFSVAYAYQLKRVFVEDDASDNDEIMDIYPEIRDHLYIVQPDEREDAEPATEKSDDKANSVVTPLMPVNSINEAEEVSPDDAN